MIKKRTIFKELSLSLVKKGAGAKVYPFLLGYPVTFVYVCYVLILNKYVQS